MKINKETSISKVLRKYPETREVFSNYNLACSNCLGAEAEKIENVAQSHDINIEELVAELNKIADKKEEE